ncbi:hypothetical protein BD626DRAFT_415240 [Schizophyllum amplum]|uniref:J domain-containing protein n=1 Tax=Schizophyllum amplum TaxID=97359 RepID=A0A550BTK0_9AGAR|nr:hypothetical protein BD626DRAFT_415240 [Auriculariopsis ampla]
MDRDDPITQFFPGDENVDLYAVFSLPNAATVDEIRKSYRRLALVHHPDKHTNSSETAKADAALKFQQVGFAYAVLSDEKRRKRYDQTGRTDEGFDDVTGEDGWEAYFEDLFDRVTRGKLDEMKKEYQGSLEEVEDIKSAYIQTDGDIGEIMTYIPHSTHDDEARFIIIISGLIAKGDIPTLKTWERSSKDEKARLVRKKQSDEEAAEAEKLAKELGVWDEFYGTGKMGQRRGKGKGKAAAPADDDEEDTSALQALILKKKQKSMSSSFLDDLAAKYTEPPKSKARGKKRGKAEGDEGEEASPRKRKKASVPDPPDIDDDEFAKIQARLTKGKASSKEQSKAPRSKGKTRR